MREGRLLLAPVSIASVERGSVTSFFSCRAYFSAWCRAFRSASALCSRQYDFHILHHAYVFVREDVAVQYKFTDPPRVTRAILDFNAFLWVFCVRVSLHEDRVFPYAFHTLIFAGGDFFSGLFIFHADDLERIHMDVEGMRQSRRRKAPRLGAIQDQGLIDPSRFIGLTVHQAYVKGRVEIEIDRYHGQGDRCRWPIVEGAFRVFDRQDIVDFVPLLVPANRVVIGILYAFPFTARKSQSIGRSMPFRNGA